MIIEPNKPAPQFPTVPGGDAGSAKSGGVSASSVERADAMSGIIVTQSPQAATNSQTVPPSESFEGQEEQDNLPASEGGTEGSSSPLHRSSGADAQPPDSVQAKPASSQRAGEPNSELPHYSPSQGAATALEGRMSSPASPAIVSSSGPVHFADREHLTVPDDVDLTIPAFLKRSA